MGERNIEENHGMMRSIKDKVGKWGKLAKGVVAAGILESGEPTFAGPKEDFDAASEQMRHEFDENTKRMREEFNNNTQKMRDDFNKHPKEMGLDTNDTFAEEGSLSIDIERHSTQKSTTPRTSPEKPQAQKNIKEDPNLCVDPNLTAFQRLDQHMDKAMSLARHQQSWSKLSTAELKKEFENFLAKQQKCEKESTTLTDKKLQSEAHSEELSEHFNAVQAAFVLFFRKDISYQEGVGYLEKAIEKGTEGHLNAMNFRRDRDGKIFLNGAEARSYKK